MGHPKGFRQGLQPTQGDRSIPYLLHVMSTTVEHHRQQSTKYKGGLWWSTGGCSLDHKARTAFEFMGIRSPWNTWRMEEEDRGRDEDRGRPGVFRGCTRGCPIGAELNQHSVCVKLAKSTVRFDRLSKRFDRRAGKGRGQQIRDPQSKTKR
ncbi:uncharacterized protein LOC144469967 [Augochlora pura]